MCCCLYLPWSTPRLSFCIWVLQCCMHYIYNVSVFLVDSSFEYYEVTFWVSFYGLFFLMSIFSDMSIATLAFFPLSVCLGYFFQPFTFSLCRSFVLSWVSGGQHMCGHVFLSIQLFYVFWLEHLSHLHLRLLLISSYSLPFYFLHTVFLSLSLSSFP